MLEVLMISFFSLSCQHAALMSEGREDICVKLETASVTLAKVDGSRPSIPVFPLFLSKLMSSI